MQNRSSGFSFLRVLNPHMKESIEENNLDLDEGNEIMCDACMLPIFSTPYYQRKGDCSQNDDKEDDGDKHENGDQNEKEGGHHFLHKSCAQLPKVLTDHPLHPKKPLILHDEFLDDHYRSGIICDNCVRECKGFFYQCPHDSCLITLDIQCAIPIKIVHRSHKHELTPIGRRGNLLTCGACGVADKGDFYCCHLCDFNLHRECASLPNTILHSNHDYIDGQQHPLTLTFILPDNSFKFKKSDSCYICHKKFSGIRLGVFFCTRCDYAAHIKCAISKPSYFVSVSSGETASRLPHLPMMDEEASLIDYLVEKGCIISNMNSSGAIEEKKKFDEHELNLVHQNGNENENEKYILCNACIDPIIVSQPFYACSHSCECTSNHLYVHKSCANLPFNLQHPLHHYGRSDCKHEPLVLLPTLSPGQFLSVFRCSSGCQKYYNGFLYVCKKCGFKLDVKCVFLPEAITYELHGKSHILFLCHIGPSFSTCNCCGNFINGLFYLCSSCPNFRMDARCALLPSSISHKYDRHPLKLTPYDDESSTLKAGDVDFCEICEKSMTTFNKVWFYHCKECITLFHVDCIPCVGLGSGIKYGRRIRVGCHNCPLASIRPLNGYSYNCSLCQKTIQGKQENPYLDCMAYECAKCGFWLDEECAERERADDG